MFLLDSLTAQLGFSTFQESKQIFEKWGSSGIPISYKIEYFSRNWGSLNSFAESFLERIVIVK